MAKPTLPKLNDQSPFPFGQAHLGKKMEDVPARYLLWLWNEGLHELIRKGEHDITTSRDQVAWYIAENMTALRKEDKDTIVKESR